MISEWDEFKRIIPDLKDSDGVINLDFAVYFPYKNSEVVSFEFGLVNKNEINEPKKYIFKDIKANKRYLNKEYITYARKIEKKVSKTGYVISGNIEDLNNYHALIIKLGIKDTIMKMIFPIDIQLTKEKPIGNLSLNVHHFENPANMDKFGMDFQTYESDEETAHSYKYQLGHNMFDTKCEYTPLYVIPNQETTENLTACFGPIMEIGSLSKKHSTFCHQ